jgi:hypothetical protein
MAFNDLPLSLQNAIQVGMLEHRFRKALRAKLGFRTIADREPFMAAIGETITKTRTGLLPANVTPMAPAQLTDITSGLTPANYGTEQYVLGIAQYATPMYLNIATSKVAIDDVYLNNAYTLGENAMRSIDTLARNALFDRYMGGNTRVSVTLGSAGASVQVDDVRGFFQTLSALGVPQTVSATYPLLVVVGLNTYTLVGVIADGVAPAALNPWMAGLAFTGVGSNTSTTPGGYSGTLMFSSNVSTADATAANAVVSAVAPLVIRPSTTTGNVMAGTTAGISATADVNGGQLTMAMVLAGAAALEANNVPPAEATGNYIYYHDPQQATGLYQDPEFQSFFRGREDSEEYRQGVIRTQLGVTFVKTNQNFVQKLAGVGGTGLVRRGILCGQGALVEGVFTNEAYRKSQELSDSGLIEVVDDIAHVTREPIDALKQVVTQSWVYAGGFVAPTDATTNPNTIPTATNSALKRAVILESL